MKLHSSLVNLNCRIRRRDLTVKTLLSVDFLKIFLRETSSFPVTKLAA
jgi:hypothetical protein